MSTNACADAVFNNPRIAAGGGGAYDRHYLARCASGGAVCPEPEEARCVDGTRAAIYVDLAAGISTDWVVTFDGSGNPCGGAAGSCVSAYRDSTRNSLTTSHAERMWWPRGHTNLNGINSTAAGNPFTGFNRVKLDKCVVASATAVDETTIDPFGRTVRVYRRADQIFEALVNALATQYPGRFTANSRVLLAGSSDGGKWLIHAVDRYHDIITNVMPGATTSLLVDAYFKAMLTGESYHAHANGCSPPEAATTIWTAALNYDNVAGKELKELACGTFDPCQTLPSVVYDSSAYSVGGTVRQVFDGYGISTDATCIALHGGDVDPERYCVNSHHVLTNHVTTPFFVLAQTGDSKGRNADWTDYTFDRDWTAVATCSTIDGERWARLRKQMIDIREGWMTHSEEGGGSGAVPPGLYLGARNNHTHLSNNNFFNGAHVMYSDCYTAPIAHNLADAVYDWATSGNTVEMIDAYLGYYDTCP